LTATKSRVPAYRRHRPTGQAVVTLNGHDIYLGRWNPKAPLTIMMGYCHYAVIYRKSPLGLPVPRALKIPGDAKDLEALSRLLQTLAWDAVVHHPLSGLKVDRSPAAVAKP